MSVTHAAGEMHVTRQGLHRVLAGTAAISPEMALRIGKFCGNGGDVWLRMQAAYDLWQAEGKVAGEIAIKGGAPASTARLRHRSWSRNSNKK